MAKKLIPEELDALIQEYLTDGVLTEKERQVILKKAEGMELDRDEIDLYLDAQVQKIDQATDAAVRKQKGKTCPFCGSPVPQLAEKCPECGQLITPEASKELQEILDNLEDALIGFKTGKDAKRNRATIDKYVRKAELYYENNPKVQKLLTNINKEVSKTSKSITQAKVLSFLKKYGWWIVAALFAIGWFVRCEMNSPEHIKSEVVELINNNELSKANDIVLGLHFNYFDREKYDGIYLTVVKAYIEQGDYNNAQIVAEYFRAQIDNDKYGYYESSTYRYLERAIRERER